MKNILFLVFVLIFSASCKKEKENMPSGQENSCNCAPSEMKEMNILVTNSGSQDHTYNLFGGSIGLEPLPGNIEEGATSILTPIPYTPGNFNVQAINGKIYAGSLANGYMIINSVDGAVLANLAIDSYYNAFYSGTNFVYAISNNTNEVYCIGTNTNTIDAIINPGHGRPTSITADNNGILYISYPQMFFGQGGVAKINPVDNSVISLIGPLGIGSAIPGFKQLEVAMTQNYIFVKNTNNKVAVVNKSTGTLNQVITLPSCLGTNDMKVFNNRLFISGIDAINDAAIWMIEDAGLYLSDIIFTGTQASAGGYFNKINDPSGTYILLPTAGGMIRINTIDFTYDIVNSTKDYYSVEFSPATGSYYASVYAFIGDGAIDEFQLSNNSFLGSITNSGLANNPPTYLTLDTDNNLLYVVSSGSDFNFYPIDLNISFPMSIVVNGGAQTIEQINNYTTYAPISICAMSVSASNKNVFSRQLEKIYANSTGQVIGESINLLENYTAFQAPGSNTILIEEQIRGNSVLDGNHYIQGVLPAGQSISFTIRYCEYDPSKYVATGETPFTPKVKRYNHGAFKYWFKA